VVRVQLAASLSLIQLGQCCNVMEERRVAGIAEDIARRRSVAGKEEPAPRESRDAVVPDQAAARELQRALHYAIKSVTEDLETFSFNTAIARLMELTNALSKAKPNCWGSDLWTEAVRGLLLLLAPVTPHMTEELWSLLGYPYSIHQQDWPVWDEALLLEDTIELPVQINGKVRARITLPAGSSEEAIKAAALSDAQVQRNLEGKQVVKVIVPRGQLVSIVVK